MANSQASPFMGLVSFFSSAPLPPPAPLASPTASPSPRQNSPSPSHSPSPPSAMANMPRRSSRQSSANPSSSSSSLVDSTAQPQSGPSARPPGSRKRSFATQSAGSSPKRIRATLAPRPLYAPTGGEVEEVDLLDIDDDKSLTTLLSKQQVELVKSQRAKEDEPPKLSTLQCIICLETPTDLSATPCGHLFCHTCLMESIIAGEQSNPKLPRCPVCRRRCSRREVRPLELKLRTKYKGKGKEPARG